MAIMTQATLVCGRRSTIKAPTTAKATMVPKKPIARRFSSRRKRGSPRDPSARIARVSSTATTARATARRRRQRSPTRAAGAVGSVSVTGNARTSPDEAATPRVYERVKAARAIGGLRRKQLGDRNAIDGIGAIDDPQDIIQKADAVGPAADPDDHRGFVRRGVDPEDVQAGRRPDVAAALGQADPSAEALDRDGGIRRRVDPGDRVL